jgi:hypothetical protein
MVKIKTNAIPWDPIRILGNLAWWVRADQGITLATGVSAWADLSGNGINFTQGTGANQPTLVNGAIGGQPAILGDGSNDRLNANWTRSAVGTQPLYVWAVVQSVTHTANDGVMGDFGTTGFMIRQTTSTNYYQWDGTVVNSVSLATGTPKRIESQFTNSTSDYLKIGSTNATGSNAGNNVSSNNVLSLFTIGNDNGSYCSNIYIAEAFAFLGTPTAQNRADLDAYCTSRYGSGLI